MPASADELRAERRSVQALELLTGWLAKAFALTMIFDQIHPL